METNEILLASVLIVVMALIAVVWGGFGKKENAKPIAADGTAKTLQLQAYERLSVLVERIALPNLIARENIGGLNAREMQMLLTQNIRQEFDYNISQQIYVSTDAWNAVKTLKEQNLLVINQLANTLPPNATGLDLNKKLLEYSLHDTKGALHELAGDAVAIEAKKIM